MVGKVKCFEMYLSIKKMEDKKMIINKEDFLKTLTEEQLDAGYFKFNIPNKKKLLH